MRLVLKEKDQFGNGNTVARAHQLGPGLGETSYTVQIVVLIRHVNSSPVPFSPSLKS